MISDVLTRYLEAGQPTVSGGIATWNFPPIPMGLAAQVSYSVPQAPATSNWTVNLNGQPIGGMAGTTLFGGLYILPNDTVTVVGPASSPPPSAIGVGLVGPFSEVPPLPPVIGGGTPQSMTVNADELQGVPVSSSLPSNLQGLVFNGSQWAPANIVNQVAPGNGINCSAETGDITVSAPISSSSPLISVAQAVGSSSLSGNAGAATLPVLTSNSITFGTSGFTAVADIGPLTGTFLVWGSYRLINGSGSSAQGQVCFSQNATSVVFANQAGGQTAVLAAGAEEFVSVVGLATFSNQFFYLGGICTIANAIYIAGGGGDAVSQSGTLLLQIA